jgi:serine protease inhibitor
MNFFGAENPFGADDPNQGPINEYGLQSMSTNPEDFEKSQEQLEDEHALEHGMPAANSDIESTQDQPLSSMPAEAIASNLEGMADDLSAAGFTQAAQTAEGAHAQATATIEEQARQKDATEAEEQARRESGVDIELTDKGAELAEQHFSDQAQESSQPNEQTEPSATHTPETPMTKSEVFSQVYAQVKEDGFTGPAATTELNRRLKALGYE